MKYKTKKKEPRIPVPRQAPKVEQPKKGKRSYSRKRYNLPDWINPNSSQAVRHLIITEEINNINEIDDFPDRENHIKKLKDLYGIQDKDVFMKQFQKLTGAEDCDLTYSAYKYKYNIMGILED